VKIAQQYGQPPHTVAAWPADWLAVAQTCMNAEAGAANERARRDERKARMQRMQSGRGKR
jgi:hypothetical protein